MLLNKIDIHQVMETYSIPENTIVLENPLNGAKVFLIGTAHVSKKSVDDVRSLIANVNPNEVMLELCEKRIGILDPPKLLGLRKKIEEMVQLEEDFSSLDISEYLENPVEENETNSFNYLANGIKRGDNMFPLFLGLLYRSTSKKLDIVAGAEMKAAAYEAAKAGSSIIFGDRDISLTLSRTWSALSAWEKVKLIMDIFRSSFLDIKEEDVEKLKNSDIFTELIKELSQTYPTLVRTLISERDQYLAWSLRKCKGPIVVGVVGAGHLKGIQEYWDKEIDIKSITTKPPPSHFKRNFLLVLGGLTFLTLAYIAQRIFS